jgi:large subunit ribosomal protein L1
MGQTKAAVIDGATPEVNQDGEVKATAKARRGHRVRGQHYKAARAKVDTQKLYPVKQAVELVKETSFASFDSTVELHLVVNKEGISVQTDLPNSTGQQKKIEVADESTVEKLKKGVVDFDVLLATSDMMPKLVPFARILGPKGLMPNPKNGTLIKNPKDAEKFSGSTMTIKTERKAPLIHTVVGKVSMEEDKLAENVNAVLEAVGRRRVRKAYLSATMSPSVKIDVA